MSTKRNFLDVSSSVTNQEWVERLDNQTRNTALAISQTLDVPELLGRVMAGRGVMLEDCASFLQPTIRETMPDPDVLTDMKAASSLLADTIQAKKQVAIFGDYDVDGASSAALMAKFLDHHGVANEIYIPDRIFEGYGPNPDAINALVDNGAKLIVTVDCGATSFDALEAAKQRGIEVIVLDHHQMGVDVPPCAALVNPNRQDDLSGLGHLCAAGVVFMTLVACTRELRSRGAYSALSAPDLLSWLDIVALATVCDVVPLKGLNRAFVVQGLAILERRKNIGLKELMRVGRLDGPPRPYHLGFVLGPRINAGGRIGDAALGSRLLTTDEPDTAQEIAEQLEMLNQERQRAEKQMFEEAVAEAQAEFQGQEGPAVLVTASTQWHPGIVGLLASRLKERFKRPSFAIYFDRNGKGSGSGRSISGVDLGKVVRDAVSEGLLEKGGGHAMAAGLTVMRDRLGELRGFFETKLADEVNSASAASKLKIDGALTARSATLELVELLERAGPYGQGHPQPVFAFPAHQIRYAKIVGADHVSFSASAGDGAQLRGISFRSADTDLGRMLLNANGQNIHLAGTLSADFYQGNKRVQFRLMDAAKA